MAHPFPPGPAAVLRALRFDAAQDPAPALTEADWKQALAYSDRHRVTLLWYAAIEQRPMPDWVRERFLANLQGNKTRVEKLVALHRQIRTRFEQSGVEHLVLKGPAQWPDFTPGLDWRAQYDLDFYCPAESLPRALAAVGEMGYEPLEELRDFPTDHLPVMIRKTGWVWRGDFFDVDIPIAIELHFRFWDPGTERFGPPDLDAFWQRRITRHVHAEPLCSLHPADALAYTCLHALRHLLRGDSHPNHFYEVAWFLHHNHGDAFWQQWELLHDNSLRRIQAICFLVAAHWFGCRVPGPASAEMDELQGDVKRWLEHWGMSPLESPFRPNKDEIWLHLSLVASTADRLAVLRRRLIPLRPPGPVGAVHIPAAERTLSRKLLDGWQYVQFTSKRFLHHARLLIPALANGVVWWFSRQEISPSFWRFYGASMLFNFALFIFYILYNLYLAQSGIGESLLGYVAGAMAAGSLAGSLCANVFVAWAGLRRSLIVCYASTGVVLALRVLLLGDYWLIGVGLLGGVCQSLWAVCLSPTVAQLTTERNRSFAFSLTFSSAIALGIAAGAIAGWLPTAVGSMRNAIWLGCVFAPLATVPLFGLELKSRIEAKRFFRPNPFLLRFLAALAVWGFATGALAPFFNVYFAKVMRLSTAQIGLIFSASQFTQVVAMLLAPLILRRFGLVPGIALMQAGTAVCLATVGVAPAAVLGLVYCGYTAFHYMSEPGLYSLLMKGVPEEARTSASAWNFVVVFGTHAVAAAAAGRVIAQLGYQPVVFVAAGFILLAALLFFLLLREESAQ